MSSRLVFVVADCELVMGLLEELLPPPPPPPPPTLPPPPPAEHGLPSLTSTGTATRRGELDDWLC